MAFTQTLTILNTSTIKISKLKGPKFMWYTIYADDLVICDIFGEYPKEHLPNIMISSPEEETNNTPSDTERTPENAE